MIAASCSTSSTEPLNNQQSIAAISLNDISKKFGNREILKGLSFSIRSGEIIALIGTNGAGKSTTMRIMGGIIPPTTGSIEVFGTPLDSIHGEQLRETRREIGFIFQKHNLVPRLSALTNVLHGALGREWMWNASFQALAPNRLRSEAYECLRKVGLAEHALQQARHLSGGQSQRVAIARALMQRPRIILADEPVASLDPEAGERTMELLTALARENELTLLFSTHNIDHALRYADRIVGLDDGNVMCDGPVSTFSYESLRAFYE
ncbi:MAG: phosphonate ABC transporter ATP-binding protein [Bdellovibrionales bacterium]|nr:phosphonate ABC transporter ATP-binding protein [Bdellovibrionales bacterium]